MVLSARRPDTVAVLEEQAETRVPELVPVRHGRMMVSPFTFFRGHAKGMALDLGAAPVSGLVVQALRRCPSVELRALCLTGAPAALRHQRLRRVASRPLGVGRQASCSEPRCGRQGKQASRTRNAECVVKTVRRYRDAMAQFAAMPALDVWYARADVEEVVELLRTKISRSRRKSLDKAVAKARSSDRLKAFAKLTEIVDGQVRIKSDPPLLVPMGDLLPDADRERLADQIMELLSHYRRTLSSDRRVLFDQFEFVDLARKVVGVGSVGMRCWIVLLRGRDDGDPLFLQVKEAGRPSSRAPSRRP